MFGFLIRNTKPNLKGKSREKDGGAGNRTPCLSHAKRALYHMSYTPLMLTLHYQMHDNYLLFKGYFYRANGALPNAADVPKSSPSTATLWTLKPFHSPTRHCFLSLSANTVNEALKCSATSTPVCFTKENAVNDTHMLSFITHSPLSLKE